MNDQELLRNAYEDMYKGMIQKNRQTLERILDKQFVLVHMTGMHQSRKQYMDAIEDGTLNYYSAVTEKIIITISKNTAKIMGRSRVNAAVFDGKRNTWPLQQDITCKKVNGNWHFIQSVASTY